MTTCEITTVITLLSLFHALIYFLAYHVCLLISHVCSSGLSILPQSICVDEMTHVQA
jgi:hypothetical protein